MRQFDRKTTREGWGDGLIDVGQQHDNTVVLVGDNTASCNVDKFAERWPERFYQMGISEQNMVNVSAGLSIMGKVPYYVTYSAFGVGRVFDQLRVTVGYSSCNVKIGGAHSGLSVGPDGATHQMMEDLACLMALPNFTILTPADYWETRKAVAAAYDINGPVYIRFGRESVPVISNITHDFTVGKAQVMAHGKDATCIAIGTMVAEAMHAHDRLAEEGIGLRVINMSTLKPIDTEAIIKAAEETKAIVTAEEHQINGGLGSAVAQVVAKHAPVKMDYVAVEDRYGRSGDSEELLDMYGLRWWKIVEKVKALLQV
ncbi:1-deoxy-D-xylulose-5-phosphate synthase [bacterium BMS3Bbin04]|nr:1-deoxy-D-xylulose-5-phosphate synthase [bacterium BMS3Bbin04]